ncbi:MAG: large-conductance mechanosensitive channel protein MscL [Bacteroidetes bacterium]|nr:large-conductance mechanosensitive channel protein MscL [Bacteroidota bacterium]
MGFITEFKEFVSRGKVMDLAIGVVIGGAFQKIISSLVSDVIMPPLGIFVGGVNFREIKLSLKHAVTDASGKVISEAVTLNAGLFVQTVFDFLIIAFAVFVAIKAVNRFNKKQAGKIASMTNEEKLLAEIRDLLKHK